MTPHPRAAAIDAATLSAWRTHLGDDREPGELLERLSAGTLPGAFRATAMENRDRAAFTIEGVSLTHGEVDDRASRVAGWLRSRGVEPGDRVVLCGSSSAAWVVAYLATLRVGATAVPAEAALTTAELATMVAEARPVLAFADGAAQSALRAVASGGWEVLSLSSDEGSSISDAMDAGEPIEPIEVPGSSTALLAFTSGTTGRPRGVPLSHANLLSSIRAATLAWRWSPRDALVHALPLAHQHGLGGVHATLLAGSRATIHARFEADLLARSIADDRATVLFAVPAIYRRLLDHEGMSPAPFSSLRVAISGSAPLDPGLFDRVAELLGHAPVERYGTTESGLDTSNPYDGPRRPGSVGLPLPGVSIAIMGADGTPLEPGSVGEIAFRGPQVFDGYLNDRDTASAFFPGGWFRTGDTGRVDPRDGFLTITGRQKDVIISGGLNVHPREVELALEAHPGVSAAAVVGVPSERWGEEVVAFVVATTERRPAVDELRDHVRGRLAGYKCPKRVLVIEELPANAMGKVDRRRLRQLAE
jgi:malonyl-CoA/methylmalonyl-CoA synthetase